MNDSAALSNSSKSIGLIVSIVICFGFAALGSAATTPNLADWFASLNKPAWNPPNWVFGPVWTVLYLMMAVAVWLVWCKAGIAGSKNAMIAFGVQLVLNAGWSILFFGLQRPDLALIEIVLLWLTIALTIFLFLKHSKLAAGLMSPYLAWVSFASVLNFAIWSLNR